MTAQKSPRLLRNLQLILVRHNARMKREHVENPLTQFFRAQVGLCGAQGFLHVVHGDFELLRVAAAELLAVFARRVEGGVFVGFGGDAGDGDDCYVGGAEGGCGTDVAEGREMG